MSAISFPPKTAWHKASYDRFLNDRLPQLLDERIPLADYRVAEDSSHTCRVQIELDGGVQVDFPGLPRPDEMGIFALRGEPFVVIPIASSEDLDRAEIACVGEQLYEIVLAQLGQASPGTLANGLDWDNTKLRDWLPLDRWIAEFLEARAQRLDTTNWLSRHTHLRRLLIANRQKVFTASQMGRVDPYETPEAANIGRVFTVAVGADIRDGRLVIDDSRPEAGLGLSTLMLPFLEHNDPNRLLMAANNQRQCVPAPNPEPALVQTGYEPHDAPDFWCGRNLLTAYLSLGEMTTQDAIVLSESATLRLDFPRPIQPGDRLTDRHGIKGVVSEIRLDADMPYLSDGSPVELVYCSFGLPGRMTFGPVREALVSRLAKAGGQPAIVPPFGAPKEDELRHRLQQLGLSETGQERVLQSAGGPPFEQAATMGWVYWNRSEQMAAEKLAASGRVWEHVGLALGELEYRAFESIGAVENLKEAFLTRSARRLGANQLADELASGELRPAAAPTPWFEQLRRRLQTAGIHMEVSSGELAFRFAPPQGESLRLARPLPHPWLREHPIEQVGRWEGEAYQALCEANERMERMLSNRVPERLAQAAQEQLAGRLEAYFDQLLPPESLSFGQQVFLPAAPGFGEPQLFSAKAVAAPGAGLHPEQVGLPDEIAWTLFAPLVVRVLGEEKPVEERSPAGVRALDKILASSWVIIHRPPTVTPTGLLVFRPVRQADQVIRLHPLVCDPLNADFDGDQLAVYLPLSRAAQQEAGAKMTLSAHLERDPGLASTLLYHPEVVWGLAWRNLEPGGKAEIAGLLDLEPAQLPGLLSQPVLGDLLVNLVRRQGAQSALERADRLMRLGYQVVHAQGASLSPFLGSGLALPPMPAGDQPEAWQAYAEEMTEAVLAGTDYCNPPLGPQLLAAKVRARNRRALPFLVGPRGLQGWDETGAPIVVRHRQVDGLTPAEVFKIVPGARRGLYEVIRRSEEIASPEPQAGDRGGWSVLARARRSKFPGIVFARAAASGETDPLEDFTSQLVTGLL